MYEDIHLQHQTNAYIEQKDQLEVTDNTEEIEFKQISFDQALSQVGSSGYYQKRVFLIFGLQWMITTYRPLIIIDGFYLLLFSTLQSQKLIAKTIQIAIMNALHIFWMNNVYLTFEDQSRIEFLVGNSLNTAFNTVLPCNKTLQSIIKSIVYFGSLKGFFIFSFIADNYGRKLALTLSWSITTIGSLILAVTYHFQLYIVCLKFLNDNRCNEILPQQFIIHLQMNIPGKFTLKLLEGHFREFQNVGLQVFFAIGEFTFITLAYYVTDWRSLAIIAAIPTIMLAFANLLIFESPQFLYSKNKSQCVETLNQIAKINSKKQIYIDELITNPKSKEKNQRMYTAWDLVRNKSIRYIFIACVMMFFGIQMIYYGISFVSDQLGMNFFTSNYIIAFFELTAYLVTDFFVTKLKRKKSIILGLILVGLMSQYFIIQFDNSLFIIMQGILAGMMRFIICVIWALAFVYVSELFPSVVRSLALLLISAGGSIGSIVQTFLNNLCQQFQVHPMVVFGIIGMLCGLLLLPLKETLNQGLIENIEEEEKLMNQCKLDNKCQQSYEAEESGEVDQMENLNEEREFLIIKQKNININAQKKDC
ncbi:unnamed protein product (macronuclear) [Paramecium tetraurelia]|uniref:Major facilitator superfamily (MFS) profile domain-containing protein n=1 Tax=Paramecium tetraurelia TaxID=5888 RepID=A0EE34_PARTE|nr:uncharacterized protein GSPATT00025895001 [Paramecium tetraurelia]CAK93551.1 unnamed protein product [Paramecium tetraurelia]|eukprot:XP_001460948.1 hypothetical protein (macronuclear) [Paramecium tetraurelia strain d4-2]